MNPIRPALALAWMVALLSPAAFAQTETQVFNAFSIALANGTILKSGDKQATVTGTVAGPLFVETDEGPVEAGRVTCAATVKVDQTSARQTGSGVCTFAAEDGAQSWGDFECAGYALVGCRGTLKLVGGTGRFEGTSGEGTMIWRPSAHEFAKQLDGTALQNAAGLLIWRELKITKK
jgi:hypothetical protein